MTNLSQKITGQLLKNKKKFDLIAQHLKEKGIYSEGLFNVPTVIMKDDRVSPPAKLIYVFLCLIAEMEEEFSLKKEAVADEFGMEVDELEAHLNHLLLFGYLEKGEKGIKLALFPTLDQEKYEQQFEEAKATGKKLEEALHKLADIFNEEDATEQLKKAKALLEEVSEEEDQSHLVKAKQKPVKIKSKEEKNKQIFLHVAEEVADDIPSDANKMLLEIDFNTGVVQVKVK